MQREHVSLHGAILCVARPAHRAQVGPLAGVGPLVTNQLAAEAEHLRAELARHQVAETITRGRWKAGPSEEGERE